MKKTIIVFALFFATTGAFSQSIGSTLEESLKPLIDSLKKGSISLETIKDVLNETIEDPELYNNLWKRFIDNAIKKDSTNWDFLNDLNVKFKTFQATSSTTSSLGFTYDFNFNYSNFTKNKSGHISSSFGLKLKGNVAFNRSVNPNDFLETSMNYNFSQFSGGVVQKNTNREEVLKLININKELGRLTDLKSNRARELFKERAKYVKFSDQYYLAVSPKFSLESNQDFSKKQFVYGGDLLLGAKAWNNNSLLAQLNVFDYPFALIRLLTGTDDHWEPYGSTLPTLLIGLDNVNPKNDLDREAIVGNLDPFTRFKVESSFRTFVSRVQEENIFFNANIRYYKELEASQQIKTTKLDAHFYFVMSLQSTSGFYISYAKGKLPFDAISDKVYAVGFNYKF
jgi:hypothetical protein